MWSVFKAIGNQTDYVYIGYTSEDDVKKAFLTGALRPDLTRNDVRWLLENDNDTNIKVDIVDVFKDEYDAWSNRNDLRSTDIDSFSNPTLWPIHCHRKAETTNPQNLEKWKKNSAMINAKTAREAYRLGAFTKDQLKSIKRDKEIIVDLDKLTPKQFCDKYDLTIMFTS